MTYSVVPEHPQTPFPHPQQELYLNLARIADKLRREVEDLLKTRGISEAQYNVLRILKGSDPEGLSCGEISARMVTRDPDVTRLLDRLEQSGLVKRTRKTPDRRVVSAHVTQPGIDLLAALEESVLTLHQRQFEHLQVEDVQALLRNLTGMRQNLDTRHPSPEAKAKARSLQGAA